MKNILVASLALMLGACSVDRRMATDTEGNQWVIVCSTWRDPRPEWLLKEVDKGMECKATKLPNASRTP